MEMRLEIIQILLKGGADPNKASLRSGRTPLIAASQLGQSNTISLLLTAGGSVSATNYYGWTALHYADNANVARVLLAAGADPSASTPTGETPVETAIRGGKPDVAALLKDFHAQTNRIKEPRSR